MIEHPVVEVMDVHTRGMETIIVAFYDGFEHVARIDWENAQMHVDVHEEPFGETDG